MTRAAGRTFITGLVLGDPPWFTVDRAAMPPGGLKTYDSFTAHHRAHPETWKVYVEAASAFLSEHTGVVGSDAIHSAARTALAAVKKGMRDAGERVPREAFSMNNNYRSSYARLYMLVYPENADRIGVRDSIYDEGRPRGHARTGDDEAEALDAYDREGRSVRKALSGVPDAVDAEVVRAAARKIIDDLGRSQPHAALRVAERLARLAGA
jgi:hypothetical protein